MDIHIFQTDGSTDELPQGVHQTMRSAILSLGLGLLQNITEGIVLCHTADLPLEAGEGYRLHRRLAELLAQSLRDDPRAAEKVESMKAEYAAWKITTTERLKPKRNLFAAILGTEVLG